MTIAVAGTRARFAPWRVATFTYLIPRDRGPNPLPLSNSSQERVNRSGRAAPSHTGRDEPSTRVSRTRPDLPQAHSGPATHPLHPWRSGRDMLIPACEHPGRLPTPEKLLPGADVSCLAAPSLQSMTATLRNLTPLFASALGEGVEARRVVGVATRFVPRHDDTPDVFCPAHDEPAADFHHGQRHTPPHAPAAANMRTPRTAPPRHPGNTPPHTTEGTQRMTTPAQGPDLAIDDVRHDPDLSRTARALAVAVHARALRGDHTGFVDLREQLPSEVPDVAILDTLDELTAAGVLDADGWPRTAVKP